jgi:subtilisin family serine protease
MPVRVLGAGGSGLVSDEVSGINYAVQNGARVVNLSLGRSGTFSQAEHDAIADASNVLFVVAAGNDGVNVASNPQYPCSLALPNMICVAASTPNDTLAAFSNFGPAVNIAAPGVNVLSTYPFRIVVSEGFEQPLSTAWTFGGTPNSWGRSNVTAATGSWSLADSPSGNYGSNADNWASAGPYDLSSYDTCRLSNDFLSAAQSGDNLRLETASAPQGPWTSVSTAGGAGFAYSGSTDVALPITSTTYFRYHFLSNASGNADGFYVDNVRVRCHGTYDANSYAYLSGTSMATPHVTGAAALVLARFPTVTLAQLRHRILQNADGRAAFGQLEFGRRLNVFNAVAPDAPTVSAGPDQTVNTGKNVTLAGAATAPNGGTSVTWVQTLGASVTLDNPNSLVVHFTAPSSPTTLQFKMTATCPDGPDGSSVVTVTVKSPK